MDQQSLERRTFIKHVTMAGAGAILIPALLPKSALVMDTNDALKDKQVLLVFGGWKGHEPEKCLLSRP